MIGTGLFVIEREWERVLLSVISGAVMLFDVTDALFDMHLFYLFPVLTFLFALARIIKLRKIEQRKKYLNPLW